MHRFALSLALGWTLCAGSAAAEIYQWTDAQGRLHFTEDLSRVPAEQRRAAREAATARPDAVQRYSAPERSTPASRARSGEAIQIPFQREGTVMWVEAIVNDRHRVPFLIDTGASGVSIPAHFVREMGIPIRSDTPRVTVNTAAGRTRYPVIELDSVQLGSARVHSLQATVNPTMEIGLLGGSFFNNYRYSVDTAASIITLVPNEQVRAGAASDQWRARFRELHHAIERLETYLEDREITRSQQREELETNLMTLRDELRALEIEANHAGVPQSWRY